MQYVYDNVVVLRDLSIDLSVPNNTTDDDTKNQFSGSVDLTNLINSPTWFTSNRRALIDRF